MQKRLLLNVCMYRVYLQCNLFVLKLATVEPTILGESLLTKISLNFKTVLSHLGLLCNI